MDKLKFYSSIDLKKSSLVEIILKIKQKPVEIIMDNTSKDIDTNETMFKIEPENVSIDNLKKSFPETSFIIDNYNPLSIYPIVMDIR